MRELISVTVFHHMVLQEEALHRNQATAEEADWHASGRGHLRKIRRNFEAMTLGNWPDEVTHHLRSSLDSSTAEGSTRWMGS